jgi:hypothetical protein
MAAEIKKEIKLEIGHVLFVDIVGSSKLLCCLTKVVGGPDQIRTVDVRNM